MKRKLLPRAEPSTPPRSGLERISAEVNSSQAENGHNAAILLRVLPPLNEALDVPDRVARTQRLQQSAIQLLVKEKAVFSRAGVRSQSGSRSSKRFVCKVSAIYAGPRSAMLQTEISKKRCSDIARPSWSVRLASTLRQNPCSGSPRCSA